MYFCKPRFLLSLLCTLASFMSMAQGKTYRYLVLFTDKTNSSFSTQNPAAFLSARSIARRQKFNIPIYEQDLPVDNQNLNAIKSIGARILFPLKWVNGALIESDAAKLATIKKLSRIKGIYNNLPLDSIPILKNTAPPVPKQFSRTTTDIDYGNSLTQLAQIGIDQMHQKGFRGEGTLISLLDDGFLQCDVASFLTEARSEKRIVGTLTTNPKLANVYIGGSHGTEVLSTIASQLPGKLYGTAFKASFALAQTEESEHELLVEEANWLRGAEWADSLGTDIISSSLGYSTFDNARYNHSYSEMDGKTTLVSQAAAWASRKGIVCVVSAGNEGTNALWKYITAPADADSILTVGAVDRTGIKTSFSSIGPSFDKRIKPDVAAMGLSTIVSLSTNAIGTLSGTSFSAPLIAGLVAGVIQAFPQKLPWEIIDAIRKSGTQATNPDNALGYGIPNFTKASFLLNPVLASEPTINLDVHVFPNPLPLGQKLSIQIPEKSSYQIEMFNSQGICVMQFTQSVALNEVFLPPFLSGKYFIRFTMGQQSKVVPMILNL